VLVSQRPFGAAQAPMLPALHSWQAPLETQTGVAPGQSAAAVQPRQVRAVPSQIGLSPAQSVAARQPTHTTLTRSHRGVAPVQAVLLPAEQVPHAPLD
jgi:hypothetical protein